MNGPERRGFLAGAALVAAGGPAAAKPRGHLVLIKGLLGGVPLAQCSALKDMVLQAGAAAKRSATMARAEVDAEVKALADALRRRHEIADRIKAAQLNDANPAAVAAATEDAVGLVLAACGLKSGQACIGTTEGYRSVSFVFQAIRFEAPPAVTAAWVSGAGRRAVLHGVEPGSASHEVAAAGQRLVLEAAEALRQLQPVQGAQSVAAVLDRMMRAASELEGALSPWLHTEAAYRRYRASICRAQAWLPELLLSDHHADGCALPSEPPERAAGKSPS